MKTKIVTFLGSLLFSCLSTDALAQFGQPVGADQIIGSTIRDSQDQKLGTVKDLALDMDNGRIVEVIVAHGGFFGLDSKFVAVPPEKFTFESDHKTLRIEPTAQRLENGPQVDLSKWTSAVEQSRVEQVYQYYNDIPYFLMEEHQAHDAAHPVIHHLGAVQRASVLLGAETLNLHDQKLGKVEDIALDLPNGRIVELTIATGNFLGMPGELSAMPSQAVHFDSVREAMILDTTKDALSSAPHFPAHARPEITREQATEVYQAYHVLPYFLPVGTEYSAQNTPSIKAGSTASPVQGTSQGDLEITARIQKEIMAADGLSADAKAVKVITADGHVTLRGMVATADEKRRLGEIAAHVVPADHVDNQLVVKETASAAN